MGNRRKTRAPEDCKTTSRGADPRQPPHRRTARPASQVLAAVAEVPDATGDAAEVVIAVETEVVIAAETGVVGAARVVDTIVTETGDAVAVAAAAAVAAQDVMAVEGRTADTTTTRTGVTVAVEQVERMCSDRPSVRTQ